MHRIWTLLLAVATSLFPVTLMAGDHIETATSMEFVLVRGGAYVRGDEGGSGRSNERPSHEVRVDDFYMGKYEVTVDQFAAFARDTGHLTAPERRGWVVDIDASMGTFTRRQGISWKNPGFNQSGSHPVVWVDWNDAAAFAAWLSARSGGRYSLPTEAQWEFAAKGAGSQRWAGTSDARELSRFAWYSANSGAVTHEVGLLQPNGFGIHDLSGNVWEWCQDGYHAYGRAPHTMENPVVKEGDTRIIRGGSWRVDSPLATTTYRNGYRPDYSHSSMGFRLVREKE